MFCSNCGKEISDQAKFCGFCGHPTPTENANPETDVTEVVTANAAEAATEESTAANAAEAATEESTATNAAEAATGENAAVEAATGENATANVAEEAAKESPVLANLNTTPEIGNGVLENMSALPAADGSAAASDGGKKKKGKGAKVAIICCVVLFVLVGLGIGGYVLARTKFENSFHSLFDKPKDYYLYVEKKNAERFAEGLPKMEDRKAIDLSDCNIQETVTLKLGTKGKDYVNLLSAFGEDLDFAWLDSFGFTFNGSVKDQKFGSKYSPILNGVKIATGDVRFDLESGELYGGLPELSNKYFGLNLKEAVDDYDSVKDKLKESFGAFGDVADAAPDQETTEKMASRYYDLIMENLDEKKFTKSKETLSCGKDSVDCTVITVTLKPEDLQKVFEAIINEMMEDEDLAKLIKKTGDSMGKNSEYDGEKVYKEFLESLKKSLEDIAKIEFDELNWKIYVDKEGLIVGRTVHYKKDDKPLTAKYAKLEKNDAMNLEFSVTDEKKTYLLSGTGKTEKGLFNGEFDFIVDEENLLTFVIEDYELELAAEGRAKGAFIIKFGEDFDWYGSISKIPNIKETSVWPFLSQMSPALKIKFDVTDKKHNVELMVMDGKDELFALAFEGSYSRAEQVQMPEDVIEIGADKDKLRTELIAYLIGCDTDGLFENLKAAKVPEKWWESLQETLELLRKYYR